MMIDTRLLKPVGEWDRSGLGVKGMSMTYSNVSDFALYIIGQGWGYEEVLRMHMILRMIGKPLTWQIVNP